MTEPEQWRFQWPDGTWIRWNPQTQAWEKEPPGADEPAAAEVAAPEVAVEADDRPEVQGPELDDDPPPVDDDLVVEDEVILGRNEALDREPAGEETDLRDELSLESDGSPAPRVEARSSRGRRAMVDDVLPPTEEPDRPGGSLWPTILTGMIVGLGVGLLLWNVIR